MNHQAGPESDGADSTPEPTGAGERSGAGETGAGETGVEKRSGAGETGAEATVAEGITAGESGAGEPGAEETGAEAEAPEPARPDTGEPRVDAALTLLDRLSELPVTEHAAVFERVHAELTAVLGQLDPESADTDG